MLASGAVTEVTRPWYASREIPWQWPRPHPWPMTAAVAGTVTLAVSVLLSVRGGRGRDR